MVPHLSGRRRFLKPRPRRLNPYFPQAKGVWKRRLPNILFVTGSVILIAGFVFIFLYPGFRIAAVEVTANDREVSDQITATVNAFLRQPRFGFFKNNNYWLLAEDNLKQRIETDLLEIAGLESLVVDKIYPQRLVVTATIRQPSFRYRTAGVDYLLDRQGIVSARYQPPSEEGDGEQPAPLPLLVDRNARFVQIGKAVVSPLFAQTMDQLVQLQAAKNVSIEYFFVPELHCPVPQATVAENGEQGGNVNAAPATNTAVSNTNRSLTNRNRNTNTTQTQPECNRTQLILETTILELKLTDGPLVYLSLGYDANEQLDRLTAFSNTHSSEVLNLTYIDVRFPEHVYYQ